MCSESVPSLLTLNKQALDTIRDEPYNVEHYISKLDSYQTVKSQQLLGIRQDENKELINRSIIGDTEDFVYMKQQKETNKSQGKRGYKQKQTTKKDQLQVPPAPQAVFDSIDSNNSNYESNRDINKMHKINRKHSHT
jgi:hypothetical protein